jgi:tetratricopeptide (TPR) repeat protein
LITFVRVHGLLAAGALLLAAAAFIPPSPAGAHDADNRDYCANKADLYSTNFSIEACSSLIVSGDKSPKDLAVIFSYRCREYLEEMQFDRALQDCSEAIWLDSDSLPAHQIRGLVYEQTQQYDRAVTDFAQVIAQQPSNASAWEGLCRNELSADHVRLAISACSESLRLRPGDAPTYVTRGLAYLTSGAFDKAIADFNTALRGNPVLPAALYGRGIAKLNRHDNESAAADIAAAKSIQGDIGKQLADLRRLKPNRGSMASTSLNPDEMN